MSASRPVQSWFGSRSLTTKVLLINGIVLSIGGVLTLAYQAETSRQNTVAQCLDRAKSTIEQYSQLRAYYTEVVVKKCREIAGVRIDADYKTALHTIPLPATMIHDLADLSRQASSGVLLRLYSEYPFPSRKDRLLDRFALDAITFLKAAPAELFVRTEIEDGKETLAWPPRTKWSTRLACSATTTMRPLPKRGGS